MQVLKITSGPLEVSMQGPKGKERLKIRSEYPDFPLSQPLFEQLGLMHLIAPYLPRTIKADFPVAPEIKGLISAMYKSEGKRKPRFTSPKRDLDFSFPSTQRGKAAVAYSAGKDSMWNMMWAQDKYGDEDVLCVHVSGLNKSSAPAERKYSERQAEELDFKNFQIIDLLNSSQNTGFPMMRSRDMFLTAITMPLAIEFGASQIITEGFAETVGSEAFTGLEENMEYFNKVIDELGIPVKVTWRDKKEMDIVKELIEKRPHWMSHVHNCFAIPPFKIGKRKQWEKLAPTVRSKFYDSQCGGCAKCRIINIGRILYDPKMQEAETEDIQKYLEITIRWIRDNKIKLREFIEGSFMRDFKSACKKYNVQVPDDVKSVKDK